MGSRRCTVDEWFEERTRPLHPRPYSRIRALMHTSHKSVDPGSIVSSFIPEFPDTAPLSTVGDDKYEKILSDEVNHQVHEYALELTAIREKITLLRSPLKTISVLILIFNQGIKRCRTFIEARLFSTTVVLALLATTAVFYMTERHSSDIVRYCEAFVLYHAYWVFLGILSSVGLGTGLHTFVLYLGPHVALYTMQVTACNSMDIEPEGASLWKTYPYFGKPDFNCGSFTPSHEAPSSVSLASIFSRVWLSAFLWGVGTSIGELPPYFVAAAARAAGKHVDELDDVLIGHHHDSEELVKDRPSISVIQRVKIGVLNMLKKHGFITIVLFASIPNPLFDLAGLLCGHLGVPFWTFFGGTFIGKACIKSEIQTLAVIAAVGYLDNIISFVGYIAPSLANSLSDFLRQWRSDLQSDEQGSSASSANPSILKQIVGRLWDLFLFLMIAYFILSIVDSLVQGYLADEEAKQVEQYRNSLFEQKIQEREKVPPRHFRSTSLKNR
uniref:Vacuole membrane protein 1 n=1 Tax=Palpitomonas bilix TaxID=652834 RepID=A0A7S3D757_9EUKA|mmetsp:Transcript_25283/g.63414  ORF Transcript_25283/g.63414 Transcript_25283/m.63414 type:complete len:498 (+) Transcript_25283:70-1563(+)